MYSVWENVITRNGFQADEIISSFQKAVRRNMEEQACEFAYELYITSPTLLNKLWTRILVISVEDIGFGNLNAAPQVNALNEMRKQYPYDDVDQPIYFIHAIRILCSSPKDRSSDFLKNIIIKGFTQGHKPTILDVGLDKHTRRGREMGRDSFHFFHEGAKVVPQIEVENDYRARYQKILETYDTSKNIDDPFKYGGQY